MLQVDLNYFELQLMSYTFSIDRVCGNFPCVNSDNVVTAQTQNSTLARMFE